MLMLLKPYRYKKSSLKSETTENEKKHKIPRKNFVLWAIKILRIRWYNYLSAHRHIAITMISLTTGIVLQLSVTGLLAALLEGSAECFVSLLWVHHPWLCSYECGLQEFLWYGFKISDGMYQTGNIYNCPERNLIYCII